MKKILIPTDFSPVADNALQYAIEIAAAFKSEIYLYHAYYIHKVDYNLDYPEDEQPYKRQVERKMELTKQKFQEKIIQKELSIQAIVEHDFVYALFQGKAKSYGIDLIVMGSKGASGLEKVIFGTVAGAALELSKVPVLIVPPRHSFHHLEHIMLAVDQNTISSQLLAPVQQLAYKFGAKVIGLHVVKGIRKSTDQKIDLYLKDVQTTYREVPISGNVNDTISDFTRRDKCDLLCMVRREKGFFEGLFQKSITKTQVYNNSIPLLVLPEN